MTRPVQQSLIDPTLERPVGPIPMSVVTGNNSDLIAKVAPLYLTGSVLDTTYGKGMWWQRFVPEPFTFHDLALDGVDFRDLPYGDGAFDAVCFDPPYVRTDAVERTDGVTAFKDYYGLNDRSHSDLWGMVAAGLVECARGCREWLLVKCNDYADGGYGFVLGHYKVLVAAEKIGLVAHDLIVHASGTGPGGHNIYTPKRARRAHSYLLVFRKPGAAGCVGIPGAKK